MTNENPDPAQLVSDTASKLRRLKAKRAALKGAITRSETFVNTIQAVSVESEMLMVRRDKLVSAFEQYEQVNIDIQTLDETDCEDIAVTENKYFHVLSKLDEAVKNLNKGANNKPSIEQPHNKSNCKLPNIEIPYFDGKDFTKFKPFMDLFCAVFDQNESLSNVQKLFYLRKYLCDDALGIIVNMPIVNESYPEAMGLLRKRFENKSRLVSTHINVLLDLPSLQKGTAANIRSFISNIQQQLYALKNLEMPTREWDMILISILTRKLDTYTNRAYHLDRENPDEMPTMDELISFLERRAVALEESPQETVPTIAKSQYKNNNNAFNKVANILTNNSSCGFCKKEQHPLYACPSFQTAAIKHKLEYVNSNSLCTVCLKNHKNTCKFNFKCKLCKQRHNTLLHEDQGPLLHAPQEPIVNCHANTKTCNNILLPSIKVKVHDSNGGEHLVKAILDSGSQANLMCKALADKLNLKAKVEHTNIIGVGNKSNKIKQCVDLNVYSCIHNVNCNVSCYVVDNITPCLPQHHVEISNINIPENIKLSDVSFNEPSEISMLLGADVYFNAILDGHIKIENGPVLQNTLFGYVVGGKVNCLKSCRVSNTTMVSNFVTCENKTNKLENIMEQFWLTEKLPGEPAIHTAQVHELEKTEKIFQDTVKLENNKYQVDLPLKAQMTDLNLGDSFSVALQRFLTLEQKFKKSPSYFQQYSEFIKEYVAMGHAKIVDILDGPIYFLAHHAVINLESISTRLRVVFDGSTKSKTGESLNDVLLNGPVVQSELFDILLLWRTFLYTLNCDITKMFRAISINPEQTPLQNILWRSDPSEPIKCLQLQTVTYGLKPSNYLATRCLIDLAERYKEVYPLAAEALKKSTFVDDIISGSDEQDQLIELRNQLVEMLKRGGFTLHKWCSNLPQALDGVPNEHKYLEKLDINKNNIVKTLGLKCDVLNDQLTFTCPVSNDNEINTKRKVLSYIGQSFDPLGIISPILVVAKLQMQRLWAQKLGWDTILPQEELRQWNAFMEKLKAMGTLAIPRCVNFHKKASVELVGYADASMKAFGCNLYLRILDINGMVHTNLLCSKSRIAPLNKSITIPKLELNSALLLAQLTHRVYSILSDRFPLKVFLYSDSQITLAWIKANTIKSNIYVSNRVLQIQALTKDFKWLYVPTYNNPADLISRGCDPDKLKASTLWWHGSSDLSNPEFEHVSSETQNVVQDPSNDESNVNICNVTCTPEQPNNSILNVINKHSDINRIQRIIAYVLRFCHNCKLSDDEKYLGSIIPIELNNALITIISCVQNKYFNTEITALKTGTPIKSGIASLHPFLDHNNVMRVGGRLQNAENLPYNQVHPAILPKHCHLTTIIIQKEHMRLKHAGARAVLGSLSERFWIISGICQVKNIVSKCIICAKLKFKAAQQLMGSLPKERLDAVRPYHISGVDFCGPFNVKMSRIRRPIITKGYVAVFVCFATKAIHLELVSDLTTEAFLACLKRFIARRGMPTKIFCDNAKTFKGAANELKRLHELFTSPTHINAVENYCAPNYIHFKFIPSYAPEFGGLWEAGVKSFKHHFKRIVGNVALTYEGLYTVMTEIEAILNSRPLLPLNSDSSSCEYLTPGHFIIGKAMISYPEIDLSNKCVNRLRFWNMLTKIKQDFWKIWSRDYLTQLQNRPKWKQSHPNLKEGDLVIVRGENTSPLTWPMARIVKTIPGPDGRVRVVEVKMNNKIYTRSLQKICPLPI